MKVQRFYIEKQQGFDTEARRLQGDLADLLGGQYPEMEKLKGLRILHRYDVSDLDDAQCTEVVKAVLSVPRCDRVFTGNVPQGAEDRCFAVEYLPGQYNQRADSLEQNAELVTGIRPVIRTAVVYIIQPGALPVSDAALIAVKHYLINPVDSREVPPFSEGDKITLDENVCEPDDVPVLSGFIAADDAHLEVIARNYGFAMNLDDLRFCCRWFTSIGRDPTLAEMRVLDTYWSDHCRHTTFNTVLESIEIEEGADPALVNALALYESARDEVYGTEAVHRPRSLMDMAVIGTKVLRKRGLADDVDESKEINACTIKMTAEFSDDKGRQTSEPWLLFFKNETHNHPTEIEPFGGAATCLGGAIRDPLSGRAFVHQAMRITGGGDPTAGNNTLPGKLPQIKIAREAAAGYSSYGNQIGLAAGQVTELYHSGFIAKRMELGAVIGAAPADWVRREEPAPGDVVLLVGGRTGRDGIGGATGSSKGQSGESVQAAGAEVQKGNAPEERKIVRLFRNPQVTRLIKRCNDFGAGGVSVAVGELAAGLDIDLDAVPVKYLGLNGLELAISESQERMAVVCAAADAGTFINFAAAENLEAVIIAVVTADDSAAALKMRWRGKTIVDLSRQFLNTNGAPRTAQARIGIRETGGGTTATPQSPLTELVHELASLRSCSRRGLQEYFDGSAGSSSVLFPLGGAQQGTPECGMAALLSLPESESPANSPGNVTPQTASLMSFGYDPYVMEHNPYEGAKGAIREALAKFACLGGDYRGARLSLQEYFPRTVCAESWGKPAAALLGALEAQLALGIPAIGGKDSMSGNYQADGIDICVPPTLVAFAAGVAPAASVRSGALCGDAGNTVILLAQSAAGLEEWEIFKSNMEALAALSAIGCVRSAYPVTAGGVTASLAIMAFGNSTGLEIPQCFAAGPRYQGSILAEIDGTAFRENHQVQEILSKAGCWETAAFTIDKPMFRIAGESEIPLATLRCTWESPLIKVYPHTSSPADSNLTAPKDPLPVKNLPKPLSRLADPLVIIPVFPGTNGEWDMEQAFGKAGGRMQTVVFRNRSRDDIASSMRELATALNEGHILALPGGYCAGEPDGSGKFIANVLRSPVVADAVHDLLENRGGLIMGIGNGFQALIQLGLIPYGKLCPVDYPGPAFGMNHIGRHISCMVRTQVMANCSPWLALEKPGTIHVVPASHSEGRLVVCKEESEALFANGQVPFCYVDNPNGSDYAIEALCSPDGRILGKMAHSERCGKYVHINIPGNKEQSIFSAGVQYFH